MDKISLAGLLPAFAILLLLLLSIYKTSKNLSHPLFLFTLLWTFVLFFSLLSGTDYYFSYGGLYFLVALTGAFYCGWIFSLPGTARAIQPYVETGSAFEFYLMAAGTISGMLAVYMIIRPVFEHPGEDDFFSNLSRLSATLSRARYEGDRLDRITMLCLTMNYLACFIGGNLLAVVQPTIKKLVCLSPLLSLLLFTIISTSRAVLLFGLVCFISVHLLNIARHSKYKNVPVKWLIGGLGIAFFGLVIFVFSQAQRMGIDVVHGGGISFVFNYLKVWFAGNISSFCIWYDQSMGIIEPSWGKSTFAGMAEWMGLGERKLGIYDTAYDVSGKMEFSNVFTLFRFLIDDFGWITTFFFLNCAGFIAGKLYDHHLSGSRIATALLAGIMIELNFSFITSILAYNSVLIAFLLFLSLRLILTPVRSYA